MFGYAVSSARIASYMSSSFVSDLENHLQYHGIVLRAMSTRYHTMAHDTLYRAMRLLACNQVLAGSGITGTSCHAVHTPKRS